MRDGLNSIEIMSFLKNGKDDSRYACAIFVVKNIEPYDLINYVKTYQPVISFQEGLNNIKKTFESNTADLDLCETEFKLDLRCSIT